MDSNSLDSDINRILEILRARSKKLQSTQDEEEINRSEDEGTEKLTKRRIIEELDAKKQYSKIGILIICISLINSIGFFTIFILMGCEILDYKNYSPSTINTFVIAFSPNLLGVVYIITKRLFK